MCRAGIEEMFIYATDDIKRETKQSGFAEALKLTRVSWHHFFNEFLITKTCRSILK